MSLGLGVFLGCVFLGTVFLYTRTQDTWNWRKLLKGITAFFGGLIVMSLTIFGFYMGYETWLKRPQIANSLKGVTLEEKMADVIFRMGTAEKKAPAANRIHEDQEEYLLKDARIKIGVRDGIVKTVAYSCDREIDYTEVNNIRCGNSGENIRAAFEQDVRVLCLKDKTAEYSQFVRSFDVPRYGTRYALVENKVVHITIASPKEVTSWVGFSWDKCP